MDLELDTRDRLILQNILPQKGDLITQTIVKDIIEKCKFTQAELIEGGFKSDDKNGSITWDTTKTKTKKINFSPAELNILKKAVQKLDEEGEINQDNISICSKISDVQVK